MVSLAEKVGHGVVQTFKLRRPEYVLRNHTDLNFPVHYGLHFIRDKIPHAFLNYLISRFDPSPGTKATLDTFAPHDLSLGERIMREKEFFKRSRLVDYSFRTYNGMRKNLVAIGGDLGNSFQRIFHDITLSTHGWLHMRGIEDKLIQIVQYSPEYPLKWKSSLLTAGFLPFHDLYQVFLEKILVDSEKKGEKLNLNPKAGHVPNSAVMFACFAEDMIVKELHVSRKRANEITKIAVYCFLCHDFDDNLKVINGTGDASDAKYQERENVQVLIDDIRDGKIDLSTLSWQQIMNWGRHESSTNKKIMDEQLVKMSKNPTRWGMPVEFEEHPKFRKRLEELEMNNTPLFEKNLAADKKLSMRNLATALVFADYMEMTIPIGLSIARKSKVPISKTRPTFTNQTLMYRNLDHLNENLVLSDVDRNVYELLKLYDLVNNSSLRKSRFAYNTARLNVLYGLKFTQRYYGALMLGMTKPLKGVFEQAANSVAAKLIRKFEFKKDSVAIMREFLLYAFHHMSANMLETGIINVTPEMRRAIEVTKLTFAILREDEQNTMSAVMSKEENKGYGRPRRYSDQDRKLFHRIMLKTISYFIYTAKINDAELALTEELLDTKTELPSFADTIHSMGMLSQAKTMIPH